MNANQLGLIIYEMAFVLAYDENWIRGSCTPDVLFLSAARWAAYQAAHADWREKPLLIVPELVVEVISPTDRYSAIQTKVESYLTNGVQAVWIVDPERKRVTVHSNPQEGRTLGLEETLNGAASCRVST